MVDEYEAARSSPSGWYGLYGPVVSPLDVWQAERLAEQAEQLDARITKDRKQLATGQRALDKRLAADRAQSARQQQELDKRIAANRQGLASDGLPSGDPTATKPATSSSANLAAPQTGASGPSVPADPPDHLPLWERSELVPRPSDLADQQWPSTQQGSGGSDVA